MRGYLYTKYTAFGCVRENATQSINRLYRVFLLQDLKKNPKTALQFKISTTVFSNQNNQNCVIVKL